MPSLRERFLGLILGVFCLTATGCSPTLPVTEAPSGTLGINPNFVSTDLQVTSEWIYQDEYRFAMEISIEHYPLPLGFQTRCPLTRLEVKSAGRNMLLYRNPDQINLDEFYALAQDSRWYCTMEREGDGFADYLFSLTYFFWYETFPDSTQDSSLVVELGKVAATNSISAITLPARGDYELPLEMKPSTNNLTWLDAGRLVHKGISVKINQVAVNPSFTSLDACIEYADHHDWKPRAILIFRGQDAYSTELLSTYPYPFDRDTLLQSTRRCYSFSIPFVFPVDSSGSFQVGIDQVVIDNTDPGVVTMQECEAVKASVENSNAGLEVNCREFESHGQPQHWFEVVSCPPEMSSYEAYKLVESAFMLKVTGQWVAEFQLK